MDFDCQRCGWCCRNININVSYSDIIRWAKEKRFDILSEISYIDHEDSKKRGFYILKTVTAPRSACLYLTTEDGLSSCSIYNTRPRSCAEFPDAHARNEKEKIECPARGDFELDEKTLSELKREQAFDFMLAEDRKEKLVRILAIAKDVHEGLGILKEFGDDPTETLKVTTLGTERTAWTEVGTLHLQEQDEPTHYIWTTTKKAEHGDFEFANTAFSGTTLNSVTLYVYAKNANGARVVEYYIWDGTSWTEYTLNPTVSYSWLNIAVPVLDTWTKVDGAKLYVKQPNSDVRTDIDAAYLLCDYTSGVIDKGFSDSGSGTDVFTKVITFQSPEFSDSGAGADVFENLYRAMGFADSISGADVFTKAIILQAKAFVDTIAGSDAFTLLRFLDFVDTIAGADVFTLTRPMDFTDSGSGLDVFTKATILQLKSFTDSGAGADVFDADWKALDFSDTGSGSDVFTVTVFRAMADSGSGTDVWTLTRPIYFTDVGSGADVFSIDYKEMGFDDVGSGSDVFAIVLKALGFIDSGAGADVFTVTIFRSFTDSGAGVDIWTLTRPMYMTDVGSGSDVFTKVITFQTKAFTDSGAGADVFTQIWRAMGFTDVGSGADVFGVMIVKDFSDTVGGVEVFTLTRPVYMTDVGSGSDVFTIPWKLVTKTFADSGYGADVFTLLRFLDFVDSGTGADIFLVSRELDFTDSGSGADVFTNPFRAVEFIDTGYGTDSVSLLRMVGFSDTVSGADVFSLSFLISGKDFSDTVTGSDVFDSVLVIDMAFDDTGTGVDVFSGPLKLVSISEADKLDIAKKVWDRILDSVLENSAGAYLVGVADAVWDETLADHLTPGTTGEALNIASEGGDLTAIAAAVWDMVLYPDHVTDDTAGKYIYEFYKLVEAGDVYVSTSTSSEILMVRERLGDAGVLITETVIDEEAISTNTDAVFPAERLIYEVSGIWLTSDPTHSGTDYYDGINGEVDTYTGKIIPHTSFPNANTELLINYTFMRGLPNNVIDQFLVEAKLYVKKYTRKDYDWSLGVGANPDEEVQIALMAACSIAAMRCLEVIATGDILQFGYNFRLGDLQVESMTSGGFHVQAHIDFLKGDVERKLAMLGRAMYFVARSTKRWGRDAWGYKREAGGKRRVY